MLHYYFIIVVLSYERAYDVLQREFITSSVILFPQRLVSSCDPTPFYGLVSEKRCNVHVAAPRVGYICIQYLFVRAVVLEIKIYFKNKLSGYHLFWVVRVTCTRDCSRFLSFNVGTKARRCICRFCNLQRSFRKVVILRAVRHFISNILNAAM